MAQVMKKRRLVNPAGRRRRMTPKQIKYFGTARQRAALKNRSRRNAGPRSIRKWKKESKKYGYGPVAAEGVRLARSLRSRNQGDVISRVEHAAERAIDKIEDLAEGALGSVTHLGNRGRRNVGEILTVLPANPGRRRRKVAATTRRRNRSRVRVSNRRPRRRNRARARHRNRTRRMANPKVVVRYRNRARRHHYGRRRRNPDFLMGDAGKVVGVLGGAAVTGIITGYLPTNLTSGFVGYLSTAAVAAILGQVTGKVTKNRNLGNWVTVGGLLIVGMKLLQQVMPQLQLPFTLPGAGTSGMGLLSSSNFYVPQVNMPGSMATFVTPAGIPVPAPVAIPAGMAGFGAGSTRMNMALRRIGRMR